MGLFKSKRQRQLEAEIRIRQSKAQIQRFLRNARTVQKRYWELGKQALRLGDRTQFSQLAAAFLRTGQYINQWERYLLLMETLSVRREEVAVTGEFLRGISAITNSILNGVSPDQIAAMQEKLFQALAKAEALEQFLAMAMETSADAVFTTEEIDAHKLDELASQMASEAEEQTAYDERIAQTLQQIEQQMRKEL